VIDAEKVFRIIGAFLIIPMSILERNLINANFVLLVLPVWRHIEGMKEVIMLIKKDINVVDVAKVFQLIGSFLIIPMFILERNLINVSFVLHVLPVRRTIDCMKGGTLMIRKNSDVIYVGKAFCLIGSFLIIPMSILERNLTNANFVLNVLPIWGHMPRMKEVIPRKNTFVIYVTKAF